MTPETAPDRDWYRFYTPEEVERRLEEGLEPIFLAFESVDGAVPTLAERPILYGWRRWIRG